MKIYKEMRNRNKQWEIRIRNEKEMRKKWKINKKMRKKNKKWEKIRNKK